MDAKVQTTDTSKMRIRHMKRIFQQYNELIGTLLCYMYTLVVNCSYCILCTDVPYIDTCSILPRAARQVFNPLSIHQNKN